MAKKKRMNRVKQAYLWLRDKIIRLEVAGEPTKGLGRVAKKKSPRPRKVEEGNQETNDSAGTAG
jgi:hypothetical protein